MAQTEKIDWRELGERGSDGIDVKLLWRPGEMGDEVMVTVNDERAQVSFAVTPSPDEALEAFYHPYAYRQELGEIALSSP